MIDELLTCPDCYTLDLRVPDMCWCRHPICWNCHDAGSHHWREVEKQEAS